MVNNILDSVENLDQLVLERCTLLSQRQPGGYNVIVVILSNYYKDYIIFFFVIKLIYILDCWIFYVTILIIFDILPT